METRQEDAMDLGGFLENYVLSNPFSNRAVVSNKSDPSSSLSESSAATSPDESIDVNKDTKCGHVGSNRMFAESIKEKKVSIAQKPLQGWLLGQYCCIRDSPVLLKSTELLNHVQQTFPNVTSIVLSRIMRFTFPDARKIVNRRGMFWQGILKVGESASTPLKKTVKELLILKRHSEIKSKSTDTGNNRMSESTSVYGKSNKHKRRRIPPSRRSKSLSSAEVMKSSQQSTNCNGITSTQGSTSFVEDALIKHRLTNGLKSEQSIDRDEEIFKDNVTIVPVLPLSIDDIKKENDESIADEPADTPFRSCNSKNDICDKVNFSNENTKYFHKINGSESNYNEHTESPLQINSSAVDLLLENENLKEHCHDLKRALESSQTLTASLEEALDSTKSELRCLTKELSKKNLELATLADDFLGLSQDFQRLSQRFHTALEGSVDILRKCGEFDSS